MFYTASDNVEVRSEGSTQGWLQGIALAVIVAGGVACAFFLWHRGGEAVRAAARTTQAWFWWTETTGVYAAGGVALIAGMAVAMKARAQLARWPTMGWGFVGVVGALMLLALAVGVQSIQGGYAGPGGAVWVRGAGGFEQRAWSQATGLKAGCDYRKARRRHSSQRDLVRYDVAFGQRKASLGGRLSSRDGGPKRWLSEISQVDAALPAGVAVTHAALDATCIRRNVVGLDREQAKAMVRLLRPTPQDVDALNASDSQVGDLVAEALRTPSAAGG